MDSCIVQPLSLSRRTLRGLSSNHVFFPTKWLFRWRSLATGIAVAGAGVGTVLFSPINDYIMTHYGWRMVFVSFLGRTKEVYLKKMKISCVRVYFLYPKIFSFIYILGLKLTKYPKHPMKPVFYSSHLGILFLCFLCGLTFRPLEFVLVSDEDQEVEMKPIEVKNVNETKDAKYIEETEPLTHKVSLRTSLQKFISIKFRRRINRCYLCHHQPKRSSADRFRNQLTVKTRRQFAPTKVWDTLVLDRTMKMVSRN